MWKRYERCRKVCGDVGGGNGKGRKNEENEVREMWGSVGGSVLGPHTLIHFPTPPSFLSPHLFPTRQHTSPLTPTHSPTLLHSPHIFPCLPHTPTHFPTPPPYLFPQLLSPPPTPQHTSHSPHALSHTSPHIFPHSFDYVAKFSRDNVIS